MSLFHVITLYFCHAGAKKVHHFVSSVWETENYLLRLWRFMLLITSYLLRYPPNLRININSLIYGKKCKMFDKSWLSLPRFFIGSYRFLLFSASHLCSRQNWLGFQTYNINFSNNSYGLIVDVNFTLSMEVPGSATRAPSLWQLCI